MEKFNSVAYAVLLFGLFIFVYGLCVAEDIETFKAVSVYGVIVAVSAFLWRVANKMTSKGE